MMSSAHRAERRRIERDPRRLRAFGLTAIGVLFLVGGWAGVRMATAAMDLADARDEAETLRILMAEGDTAAARRSLMEVQSSVRSARSSLNDPTLVVASHIPVLGRNVAAPRQVARALDDVAQEALPGLISVAADMDPSKIMPGGGRVDLDALRAAEPRLQESAVVLDKADDRLDDINTGLVLPPISRAVDQVQEAVGGAADAVGTGALVAKLGPTMLGGDGPRTYLLVFQNNAEIRSTGGLPGAWAELKAVDGRLTLGRLGSAADMNTSPEPVLPVDFDERFLFSEKLVTDFRDVNFTPDWPRAAEIAAAMAEQRAGLDVDGVASVDPVALSYLLRGIGPVEPVVGERISANNAVDTLLHGVYLKYERNVEQDAYFAAVTKAVFDKLTGSDINAKAFGEGLSKAAKERRLLLWSKERIINDALAGTAIAGEVSVGESDHPKIGFYLDNVGASKMDYFLAYETQVKSTECSRSGVQTFQATLNFTSNAPPDAARLPSYITGGSNRAVGLKPGELTVAVKIFAPHQGKVISVSRRGDVPNPRVAPFAPYRWHERGVGETTVTLSPGDTAIVDVVIKSGKDSRDDAYVAMTPGSQPNRETTYTVDSAC